MPNFKEAFLSARQRVNPEGLVFSATASATSLAVLPPLSAGATYAIHEVASVMDPTLMKIVGIAAIGLCSSASIVKETKVLDSDNYSASPVASTLNVLTGKPLISSVGGHISNIVPITIFNPINAYAIATKNYSLLAESQGAASLALTSYFILLNTLISQGRTQPFINGVRKVRETASDKLNRIKSLK